MVVEPRRRLVEEQQRRLGHQRPSQLDQAALPEAERLDRPVEVGDQPEQLGHGAGPLQLVVGGVATERQVAQEVAGSGPGPLGDHQVVAHGHPVEQLHALERAGDAEPGPAVHGQAGDVDPVEHDAPLVGAQDAGQAVEQRGLAGTVRPDEADQLSGVDVERHVVERTDAGEPLGDAHGLEPAHDGAPGGRTATVATLTAGLRSRGRRPPPPVRTVRWPGRRRCPCRGATAGRGRAAPLAASGTRRCPRGAWRR